MIVLAVKGVGSLSFLARYCDLSNVANGKDYTQLPFKPIVTIALYCRCCDYIIFTVCSVCRFLLLMEEEVEEDSLSFSLILLASLYV